MREREQRMIQMSSTLSTDEKKRKVKSHTWQWYTQSSETELKSRIWENTRLDACGLGTAKHTSLNIFSTQSRKVIAWTTMHICLFYCFFHHIFTFTWIAWITRAWTKEYLIIRKYPSDLCNILFLHHPSFNLQ